MSFYRIIARFSAFLVLLSSTCSVVVGSSIVVEPPHIGHKKVLVTGGAGFVGSHVADYLLNRGDSVVIVDEVNNYYDTRIKESNLQMLQQKYNDTNLTIYRGDICDTKLMKQLFEKERPEWVCHMAARAGVRPSIQDPFVYIHSNIEGTTRLMELSRHYKVKNFVFASSSSVYGGSKSTFFDENELVDHPISPYAASKKACELFSYTWHHLYGLHVTALRFFTVYGPRGRPDMAPFKFIDSVSTGKTLQQFGSGNSSRDYTYIDDIVDGVVRAVDRPYAYEIFNLGKGSGTVLSEFVKLVQKYVNRTANIQVLPDQPGDVPYTCANVSKAQQLLGYKSTIPFEDGIAKTVRWYQEAYSNRSSTATTTNSTRRRRRLLGQDKQRLPTGSWESEAIVEPHTGKKKVLVTGGAGFIGSHVADYLLNRGDEVIIVDEVNSYYNVTIKESNLQMLTSKYGKEKLKIYRGDICDTKLMTELFEKERPEWICHMAARAGVRPSIQDPFIYIHSNVEGTTRLMELSRTYGVKNFVFASSSSVYGGSKSTYFSEDELVDHPISPYAASKKACELLSYTWHHLYGLNVTALRFFTVYGPRGRPDMAPFKFVDRVSRGGRIAQFGDGSSSRDYTYIDDIVDGVVRAVDRPYAYQIFNLGKGSGTKLNDFIRLVEKYTGNKANITVLPDQPGDVPYTCADVRKAEKLLGYKSSVPFEEGIKRTVEWYQGTYPENVKKLGDSSKTPQSKTEPKESPKASHGTENDKKASKDHNTQAKNEKKPARPVSDHPSKPNPVKRDEGRPEEDTGGDTAERIQEQKEPLQYSTFPDWLLSLAYLQWLLVVIFIAYRVLSHRSNRKKGLRSSSSTSQALETGNGVDSSEREMVQDSERSLGQTAERGQSLLSHRV